MHGCVENKSQMTVRLVAVMIGAITLSEHFEQINPQIMLVSFYIMLISHSPHKYAIIALPLHCAGGYG